MATPHQKSLHILLLEKNEYMLYNVHFTQFDTEQPSQVSI